MIRHARPVLPQHRGRERIDLRKPSRLHPGPFEPERESSDPREDVANGQHSFATLEHATLKVIFEGSGGGRHLL